MSAEEVNGLFMGEYLDELTKDHGLGHPRIAVTQVHIRNREKNRNVMPAETIAPLRTPTARNFVSICNDNHVQTIHAQLHAIRRHNLGSRLPKQLSRLLRHGVATNTFRPNMIPMDTGGWVPLRDALFNAYDDSVRGNRAANVHEHE